MSWFVTDQEPVAVAVGSCLCPGTPHPDGDTVYLRPELDAAGGLAVISELASEESEGTLVERLGRVYLLVGIVDWTFLDAAGAKVPVSRSVISRLRWGPGTLALANAAADLYGSAVLDPFQTATSDSSPSGRSGSSTRPIPLPSPDTQEP